MGAQRSGHVINVSSIGGFCVSAGLGTYCSTKISVEALTEALHAELTPLSIRATSASSRSENPSLCLPLGGDTLAAIEKKLALAVAET